MELSHVCLCTLCVFMFCFMFTAVVAKDNEKEKDANDEGNKWKKKDVRDYTDADIERLFDQWEDNDEEELEPDELPEWKRPRPQLDLTKMDLSNPEDLLKQTKKGQTLMMFATVSGNPNEKETDQISGLWQSQLYNVHIEMQRYTVGEGRVLFVLKDGALAFEAKDFLVQQERCERVTIEGKDYFGKGYKGDESSEKKASNEKVAAPVRAGEGKKDGKLKTDKEKSNKQKTEL